MHERDVAREAAFAAYMDRINERPNVRELWDAGADWQAEQAAATLNVLADGIKERDATIAALYARLVGLLEYLGPQVDPKNLTTNELAAIKAVADAAATAQAYQRQQRLEGVLEFVVKVNVRAEADMLAGNPIEGAHNRAIANVLREMEAEVSQEQSRG